jgi:hypothetical protein
MLLGVVGGGMSEHYIAKAAVKEKLRWFLVSTHMHIHLKGSSYLISMS